jgi:hypothetical protein
LYPQSTVPPRHSIVHIKSGGIVPALARDTHLSGWHVATGAQSSSFSQGSVEKTGALTAVADGSRAGGWGSVRAPWVASAVEAVGGGASAGQAKSRLIAAAIATAEQVRATVIDSSRDMGRDNATSVAWRERHRQTRAPGVTGESWQVRPSQHPVSPFACRYALAQFSCSDAQLSLPEQAERSIAATITEATAAKRDLMVFSSLLLACGPPARSRRATVHGSR